MKTTKKEINPAEVLNDASPQPGDDAAIEQGHAALAAKYLELCHRLSKTVVHGARMKLCFQTQARKLALLIDASRSEETFQRASGHAVCELCRLEFNDHPELENGLVMLCDGRFVKL